MLRADDPATARRLDHRGREVDREHARNTPGQRFGQIARSARQIEDDVVRAGVQRRDEGGSDRCVDGRNRFPLCLPPRRRGVPAPLRLRVPLYAATPENWGRISRP